MLNARPDLNLVNGMANSCTIVVLQAAKAGTLDEVLSNPVKVKTLFAGSGAAAANGDTVLQVDRYTMMPGQSTTLHIDRAMNTRYVALVAGYYPFPGKQAQVRKEIPARHYRTGWWNPVWHSELSPLFLAITLGGEGIFSEQEYGLHSKDPAASQMFITQMTETHDVF